MILSYPGVPKASGKYPYTERQRKIWDRQMRRRHTHSEDQVKVEQGEMQPQAKECQQPLEVGRRKNGFSPIELEEVGPCQHLDLKLLTASMMKKINCCCKPPNLWQPQNTNAHFNTNTHTIWMYTSNIFRSWAGGSCIKLCLCIVEARAMH